VTAPDLSPREAVERWLAKQRVEKADQTVSAYWYRLKHFVAWCEDQGYESIRRLEPWDLETYETARRERGLEAITLEKELLTLKQFFDYCARVGLVLETLPEAIDPPRAGPHAQTSDIHLPASRAQALIQHYRDGGLHGHQLEHVFLELVWYSCARMGALRGLDVDDVDLDRHVLRFRHRPDEDTPLKNGRDSERPVLVPDAVAVTLREYLKLNRHGVTDDYGRRPLLTTQHGRASTSTLRAAAYHATLPCRVEPCPHDREQDSCEWWGGRRLAGGCPSSRSPHQILTGTITWHLTRGVPVEAIATKADKSVETIRRYYDKPAEDDLTARQDPHLAKLTFDDERE